MDSKKLLKKEICKNFLLNLKNSLYNGFYKKKNSIDKLKNIC